jgi:hypothetical protein
MEVIFEFLFSVIGEFLLQITVEVLIELGFNGVANALSERKKRNPYLAFVGYCIFGAIAGAVSLWIVPHQIIESETTYALVNLFFTPIIAGLLMSFMGYVRKSKGKEIIRLDSFLYGFTFAFFMALIRYNFGT